MEIIEGVMGENEILAMNEDELTKLGGVLNLVTAKYFKDYLDNPNANPEAKDKVKEYLGGTIISLTLQDDVKANGIVEVLSQLTEDNVLAMYKADNSIYEKLLYLDGIFGSCRRTVMPANGDQYRQFLSAMSCLESRMKMMGMEPTFLHIEERIKANKSIFYQPRSKGQNTGIGIVFSRVRTWKMCIKAIQYQRCCDEAGIDEDTRRLF